MKTIIIIMAGGLGKRMNSDLPKVLHKVGNLPMLYRIIVEARKIIPSKILIVVGKYRQIIELTLKEYTNLNDIVFINQSEPLGTGHAIMCCRDYLLTNNLIDNYKILILSGDVPLIQSSTILNMLNCNNVKIMVVELDNPTGYGRILEIDNQFQKIVEEKDCLKEQVLITKINCGIYAFDSNLLCKYLPFIKNENVQKEYYLTDIVEIIKNNEAINIDMYLIPREQQIEIIGVNTKEQLDNLNARYNLI